MIVPVHTLHIALITLQQRQAARGAEAMQTSMPGAFDQGVLGGLAGEVTLHEHEGTRRWQVLGADLGRAMREVLTHVGLREVC